MDPVSLSLTALQAGGALLSGIGANAEARDEARALDRNAGEVATQGAEDALYSLRQGRMEAGAALSASASGGVGAGNGTLSDLMRANAEARWQQAFNIQNSAATEAANLRRQASARRKSGRAALFGGVVRAGASALSGYSDYRNRAQLSEANERRREEERRRPAPLGALPLPRGAG